MVLSPRLSKQEPDKLKKAVFSMFRMTIKYVGLNLFIMCDLFDQMILPILTYGCEVWGYHKVDAIERVHREFLTVC